jgi:hypothetical protein
MVNPLRTATFWIASAVLYLVLPLWLFLAWWVEPAAALGLGALLAIGGGLTFREVRRLSNAAALSARIPTIKAMIAVTVIAVCLIALSGIGGFGYQHYDWDKHNAVFSDLVHESWPVGYTYYGHPVALVYYIAYYLPAALVGKLWGWPAANLALAIWSLGGLILALVLFLLLVHRRRIWPALLVFVLFSGLDVVGSLITHSPLTILWPEREFPGAWSYWINHDGWSAWQYSSNVKLLFTVPNQAIAGWLITALIMLPLQTEKRSHSTLFLWGLSALWSPFITIGLAPVLWVGMLPERSWTALEWRRSFTIQNLIGLLFLGITALYYATKLAPIAPLLDTGFRAGFYLALIDGWISRLNYLLLLILFYVLEFGLFGWLIWRARVLSRPVDRRLFWAATGWLLFLPLWVFGAVNDLVMRASIPALWVYAVYLAQTAADASGQTRAVRWLLWSLLLIAALNPMQDLLLHTRQVAVRPTLQALPPVDRSIMTEFDDAPNRLIQYLGSQESPFFDLLGKAPAPGDAAASPLRFGPDIVLTRYALQQTELAPGAQTQLALTLESWQPLTTEYALATRLIDAGGQVLWEMQGWPSGRNTTTWTPFQPYTDVRTVQIPPATAPGVYVLQAYFTDPTTFDKLPAVRLPDEAPLGEVVSLEYVNVRTTPGGAAPGPVALADFGGELSLVGLTLAEQASWTAGDAVPLTLTWRAQNPMAQNYVQTLQLIDAAGRLVAQQDRQLFDGALPTTLWRPEREIVDATTFALPPDLAPGRYSLIVAWYLLETGARLPIASQPTNGVDAYAVTEISVEPP